MAKSILARTLIGSALIVATMVVGFLVLTHGYQQISDKPFYREPFKVWAHRGYLGETGQISENSIAAFELAGSRGAKGIELDIFYDDALNAFVVSHDKPYHLHNGRVLRLSEVFDRFGTQFHYWLDFKNLKHLPHAQIERAVTTMIALLEKNGIKQRVLIESQNPEALAPFANAGIRTSFWIGLDPESSAPSYWYNLFKIRYYLQRYAIPAISMDHNQYDTRLYDLLPIQELYLFTVNDDARLEELAKDPKVRIILSDKDYFRRAW